MRIKGISDKLPTYSDIDNLEEKGMSDQILGQDHGTTYTGKGPFALVRVADIESCDGNCDDVIRRTWDGTFDDNLVILVEYGRHVKNEVCRRRQRPKLI